MESFKVGDGSVRSADGVAIELEGWVKVFGTHNSELNGARGIVVQLNPAYRTCIVSINGANHSIKSANLRYLGPGSEGAACHGSKLAEECDTALRKCKPRDLLTLIREVESTKDHMHAENISAWVTDADVEAFLMSEAAMELIGKMVHSAEQVSDVMPSLSADRVTYVLEECISCNSAYDNGPCAHKGQPRKVKVKSKSKVRAGRDWTQISAAAHQAMTFMSLIVGLLNYPRKNSRIIHGQHQLLGVLVDGSSIVSSSPNDQAAAKETMPVCVMMRLVDMCCTALPKCAHVAVSLLSIVISLRPASALQNLEPRSTAKIIMQYLDTVGRRIDCPCMVESRFGVAQLLTLVPVLYHLGDWAESAVALHQAQLPMYVSTFVIRMLHVLDEGGAADSSPDLSLHPELLGCKVSIEDIFGLNADFMRERPHTFAVTALVEVLGRWQYRGVEVSRVHTECSPPPEIEASLSRREIAEYTEPIYSMFAEYFPRAQRWLSGNPITAFAVPIFQAIANCDRPSLPAESAALLRGPIHASMKCSHPTCVLSATSTSNNQTRLLSCTGGCCGLARYCSVEHQKLHWPLHKKFCRRQKAAQ